MISFRGYSQFLCVEIPQLVFTAQVLSFVCLEIEKVAIIQNETCGGCVSLTHAIFFRYFFFLHKLWQLELFTSLFLEVNL
jgi:hypothetical protein